MPVNLVGSKRTRVLSVAWIAVILACGGDRSDPGSPEDVDGGKEARAASATAPVDDLSDRIVSHHPAQAFQSPLSGTSNIDDEHSSMARLNTSLVSVTPTLGTPPGEVSGVSARAGLSDRVTF